MKTINDKIVKTYFPLKRFLLKTIFFVCVLCVACIAGGVAFPG